MIVGNLSELRFHIERMNAENAEMVPKCTTEAQRGFCRGFEYALDLVEMLLPPPVEAVEWPVSGETA